MTIENFAIFYRLGERGLLTLSVLIVAVVVMVAFWRRVQRISIEVTKDETIYKADLIFVMPVFLLLALIGFSYVSFSSPINVAATRSVQGPGTEAEVVEQTVFNGFIDRDPSMQKIMLTSLHNLVEAAEDDTSMRRDVANVIMLRRDLVITAYGQEFIDYCGTPEVDDRDSDTCEDIRTWMQ